MWCRRFAFGGLLIGAIMAFAMLIADPIEGYPRGKWLAHAIASLVSYPTIASLIGLIIDRWLSYRRNRASNPAAP